MIGLSRAAYYRQPKMAPKEREKQDLKLRSMIEEVHMLYPGYGYRRMHGHFERLKIVVNEKKIRRIMRKYVSRRLTLNMKKFT